MADTPVILILLLIFCAGVLAGVGTLLLLEILGRSLNPPEDRSGQDPGEWGI